jgi:hypothetical protein
MPLAFDGGTEDGDLAVASALPDQLDDVDGQCGRGGNQRGVNDRFHGYLVAGYGSIYVRPPFTTSGNNGNTRRLRHKRTRMRNAVMAPSLHASAAVPADNPVERWAAAAGGREKIAAFAPREGSSGT